MKKIFALFCAVFLMPTFSAQAWIGGPFSQNTFFGEQGDDGVYEAIGSGINAIGIFRIVVDNTGQNSPQVSTTTTVTPGVVTTTSVTTPLSGNVSIGGRLSTSSNVWFVSGISYFGDALGSVNSKMGTVTAIGFAIDRANDSNLVDSSFTAQITRRGNILPATPFSGRGSFRITSGGRQTGEIRRFTVFGTKVSNGVNYGTGNQ